jgi:hypothetical protein
MSHKLLPKLPKRTLMGGERNEQTRLIAALMGALVEETIKELDSRQVGPGGGASVAQLGKEFSDAIAVLTVHVGQMDRIISGGERYTPAQRGQRPAAVLVSVLRAWLDGEDPELAPALSLLERGIARFPP